MLSGKLHHRPLQLAHTLMLEIFLCVKGGHKQCFLWSALIQVKPYLLIFWKQNINIPRQALCFQKWNYSKSNCSPKVILQFKNLILGLEIYFLF